MENTQTAPAPMSSSDERTWSLLAHMSILLNLITGFLGPIVALVIYFIFKDRSRYVAYNSLSSFLFQLVFWIGAGALAGLLFVLGTLGAPILIGLVCYPFACILGLVPIGALVYGVIGAVETSQGKDFEYWLVGRWAANILADDDAGASTPARQELPGETGGEGE